jgi:hypothetical protein
MDYMITKGGLAKEMFTAKGYGETKLIADESTEEGKEKNRRVEFNITAQDVTEKKVEIDPKSGEKKVLEEKVNVRGQDHPADAGCTLRPLRPRTAHPPSSRPENHHAQQHPQVRRLPLHHRRVRGAPGLLVPRPRRRDLPRRHPHAPRDPQRRRSRTATTRPSPPTPTSTGR